MAAWRAGYEARASARLTADRAMLPDMVLLRRLMLLAWITSRAGYRDGGRVPPRLRRGHGAARSGRYLDAI